MMQALWQCEPNGPKGSASIGKESGPSPHDENAYRSPETDEDSVDRALEPIQGFPTNAARLSAGSKQSSLSDETESGISAIENAVAGAKDSVADAAADAKRLAGRASRKISKGSRRAGRQLQTGFLDVLGKEPLVLGALGVAVGAAIGAMLPSTDIEDQQLGPYRDRVRDEAGKKLSEGVEGAKDIASKTFRAAKAEADNQGFTSGKDSPMAERVAKVARTASATAEQSVRSKIDPKKPLR